MFEKLIITFFDGKPVTYNENEWDDYSYDGSFIVVKNNGAWIGMYAARNVLSVELKRR